MNNLLAIVFIYFTTHHYRIENKEETKGPKGRQEEVQEIISPNGPTQPPGEYINE